MSDFSLTFAWRNTTYRAYGYEAANPVIFETHPPGFYGAAKTRAQRTLTNNVFVWSNQSSKMLHSSGTPDSWIDEFGDDYATHLLTDTPINAGFFDMLDWGQWQRRVDHGRRKVPYALGDLGFHDVVFMWVPDPVPGRRAVGHVRDHYHVRVAEDDVIEIRLWDRLGPTDAEPGTTRPRLIGRYGTDRYYYECLYMGLIKAALIMCEENWPGTVEELTAGFGARARWDSGQLESRVDFAAAEHLKDVLFSARVTNGRPIRKLTPKRYRLLMDCFIGRGQFPKGPAMVTAQSDGKVNGATMPMGGFPFPPKPHWTPLKGDGDYQGPEDYEHPIITSLPNLGTAFWQGQGLFWGGGTIPHPTNGSIILPPYLPDLRTARFSPYRAPAPGTILKLRAEWTDPVAPTPDGKQHIDHTALDPQGGQLPAGVFAFHMGLPEQDLDISGTLTEVGGPGYRQNGTATRTGMGIAWLCGVTGDGTYQRFLHPKEFYEGREEFDSGGRKEYVPIYFDFRARGIWDLELIVPDHDGQLALIFKWPAWWFDATTGVVGGPMVQTFPVPVNPLYGAFPRWIQYPEAQLQPPDEIVEGFVHADWSAGGIVGGIGRVTGTIMDQQRGRVKIYDPTEHGYSTRRVAK